MTLGPQGALLVGSDGRLSAKAQDVAAADATGAGDVFCGSLIAAQAKRLSWRQSLRIATEAAAVKVTRPGVRAGFPTKDELRGIMAVAAGPALMQEDSTQ